MPILDPRERSIPVLPVIIITNIIPLVGIIYYDLTFFALFYLFWWETVIISFYQWLKMGRAKKIAEPDPNFTVNGKTLTHQQVNSKRYMRRMYFWVRVLMLIFYLVFIVVFVGIVQSATTDGAISFMRAFLLIDPWMKVALLAFILTHGLEYWVWIRDGDAENTSLRELGMPFDGRIIIMHIVIVLGTFGSMYASESLFPDHPKAGSIAYATVFVLLKIAIDVFSYVRNQRRTDVISSMSALRKK